VFHISLCCSCESFVHSSSSRGVHGGWTSPAWPVWWWQLVYPSLARQESHPIHEPWTMTKWPSHTPPISTPETTRGHPKTNRCNTLLHNCPPCPHNPTPRQAKRNTHTETSTCTHKLTCINLIIRETIWTVLKDLKCCRCGFVIKSLSVWCSGIEKVSYQLQFWGKVFRPFNYFHVWNLS